MTRRPENHIISHIADSIENTKLHTFVSETVNEGLSCLTAMHVDLIAGQIELAY